MVAEIGCKAFNSDKQMIFSSKNIILDWYTHIIEFQKNRKFNLSKQFYRKYPRMVLFRCHSNISVLFYKIFIIFVHFLILKCWQISKIKNKSTKESILHEFSSYLFHFGTFIAFWFSTFLFWSTLRIAGHKNHINYCIISMKRVKSKC